VEHSVDAVPHRQLPLAGLDVDVAGAVADRLRDEQVHEADDRRVAGLVLERFGAGGPGVVGRALADLLREVAQLFVGTQEPPERGGQGVSGDDHRHDVEVGGRREVVEGDEIARVEHADDELAPAAGDRYHLVPPAQRGGHEGDDVGVERGRTEVDERAPGLLGDRLRDLGLGGQPRRDDLVPQFGAVAGASDEIRHLVGVDDTGLHQRLRESSHLPTLLRSS
jgi:hypothetical protein